MNGRKDRFDLGVVIVDYKTPEETIRYVKDVISKITENFVLVVINNTENHEVSKQIAKGIKASCFKDAKQFRRSPKNRYVLTSGSNLGYAKGNNFGFSFLTDHFKIDHVVFSNNDIYAEKPDEIIEKLTDVFRRKSDVGVVGPTIIGLDGGNQNPCGYVGVWKHLIFYQFFGFVIKFFEKAYNRVNVIENAPDGYYYRLQGSFFMVRAKAFAVVGGFDSATFLYSEEAILSERMKEVGYRAYYLKTPPLTHRSGFSIRKSSMNVNERIFESALYYYRKYRKINPLLVVLSYVSFFIYERVYKTGFWLLEGILKLSRTFFERGKF